MKNKINMRILFLVGFVVLGIVTFFMSFAVAAEYNYTNTGDTLTMAFTNSVWKPDELRLYINGKFSSSAAIPDQYKAISPVPLLGFIFLLIGNLLALLFGLVVRNKKARITLVIISAVIILIGGVLQFFGGESAIAMVAKLAGTTQQEARDLIAQEGSAVGPGHIGTITAILSVLISIGVVSTEFTKEKAKA